MKMYRNYWNSSIDKLNPNKIFANYCTIEDNLDRTYIRQSISSLLKSFTGGLSSGTLLLQGEGPRRYTALMKQFSENYCKLQPKKLSNLSISVLLWLLVNWLNFSNLVSHILSDHSTRNTTDMSLGTVSGMYSADIRRLWRGCISTIQMITQLCCVEILVWCSCLLCCIGEFTFPLWYIKIIRIRINNCFK